MAYMIEDSDEKCHLLLTLMGAPTFKLPYRGKHWRGKVLANLANDHKFAKVSPANIYASIKFVEQILTLKSMKLKCACLTA